MKRVLISTIYGSDPVLYACTKVSPEELVLLIPEKTDSVAKAAIKLVKNSLGRVLPIKEIKIAQYNIVSIATKIVSIIDKYSKEDEIIINITSGRKTQSIGVLFGAYARNQYVKKIVYYPEEKLDPIYLPVMSFRLTESQRKVLIAFEKGSKRSYVELAKKLKLSTAIVYRNIDDLISQGFLEKNKIIRITDAGRIAIL